MGSAYGDLAFMNKTDPNIKLASCYEFECSASPLIGAYKSEVKKIDIAQIVQTYNNSIAMTECHIVEGANSISTPIDDKYTEAEIVKQLGLPLILVVNFKSTTLDEVIMCANYIYTNKIKCFGVILNDYDANNMSVESKYFPHLILLFLSLTEYSFLVIVVSSGLSNSLRHKKDLKASNKSSTLASPSILPKAYSDIFSGLLI